MIWYVLLKDSITLDKSSLAYSFLNEFRLSHGSTVVASLDVLQREASVGAGLIVFSFVDFEKLRLSSVFSKIVYIDSSALNSEKEFYKFRWESPSGVKIVGLFQDSDTLSRLSRLHSEIRLSRANSSDIASVIDEVVSDGEAPSASCLEKLSIFEERIAALEQKLKVEQAKAAAWDQEQSRLSFKIMSRVRWFLHAKFSRPMRLLYKIILFLNSFSHLRPTFSLKMSFRGKPWISNQPIISVVIPCYNYGNFIKQALSSVLDQTFTDFEVHIVDGGSTDKDTIEVLRSIEHPKVKVHFRQGRHLVGDNRNFGISQSSSKYVCCLDADDILSPTYLESAVFLLESQKLDIVSCSTESFGAKAGVWLLPRRPFLSHIKRFNTFSTVAVFSREIWRRGGGFHDFGLGKDHIHEDWCLWQRFLVLGGRGRNIVTPLMHYRVHSSTSLSQQSGAVPGIEQQRKAILNYNKSLMKPWTGIFSFFSRYIEYRNSSLAIPSANNKGLSALVISDAKILEVDEKLSSMLRARIEDKSFYLISLAGGSRNFRFPRHFCLGEIVETKDFVYFFKYLKSSRNAVFYSWDVGEKCAGVELKKTEQSKSRKRIVLAVPWLDFGGSSVLLNMVFTDLKRMGYDITVVASNPSKIVPSERGIELYKDFSGDIVDIPYESKIKDRVIQSVVVSRQADLLMVVGCEASYRSLPHIKKSMPDIKVVDHLYNPYGHIKNNRKYRQYIDFNIAANSEVQAALLRNGFHLNKIAVIHHGIRLAAPLHKNAESGVNVTFGFLGRFSPEKRPADFLEVAKRVGTEKFLMAGDGELLSDCRSLVSKYGLNNCLIMGFAEDKDEFWRAVDVLILTSEVEGLPLVILEAMSRGIPVIASEVGHIPYLIESGVDGFTFPAKDVDSLVDRVHKYLSLNQVERDKLGFLAREKIIKGYSSEVCSKKYDDVFRAL